MNWSWEFPGHLEATSERLGETYIIGEEVTGASLAIYPGESLADGDQPSWCEPFPSVFAAIRFAEGEPPPPCGHYAEGEPPPPCGHYAEGEPPPPCGHSACRQHWIDTGGGECVASLDPGSRKEEA